MTGPKAAVRRAAILAGLAWFTPSAVTQIDGTAAAGRDDSITPPLDISFAVSNDQGLTYPPSIHFLPDEHTTIMPVSPRALPHSFPVPYDFFVAMANEIGHTFYGGAFVLQSSDLRNFVFAPNFGARNQGNAVMWPAHPGATKQAQCAYRGPTHFDEQYAAPGAVVQDPTRPPGNLIMIYEAEIHCPVAPPGSVAGWASVGVARSSDGGKTWPLPIAQPGHENDWLDYGDDRYAGVTLPGTPPTTPYAHFYGDALPSAFVDDVSPSLEPYIYVPYTFTGNLTTKGDAYIHMARARLGGSGRLRFSKWYVDPSTGKGGWTQPGRGGLESGALRSGCAAAFAEGVAQIEYNDALGVYMLTFDCTELDCGGGKCTPAKLSLYYSTATSLETQNWTTPRLIESSTYPITRGPAGNIIDGGYPSFMSPTCEPGHLGLSGRVFLLKGNGLGGREFVSRTFTIKRKLPAAHGALPGASINATGCRPRPGARRR